MRSSLPFCHTGSSCFACCCCCRNAGQDQWPHINLPVPEDQINVFSSSGKINSRGFQSSKYQVPRSINIIFMCVYASLIYGQIITQSLIRVLKIAVDRWRSLSIGVRFLQAWVCVRPSDRWLVCIKVSGFISALHARQGAAKIMQLTHTHRHTNTHIRIRSLFPFPFAFDCPFSPAPCCVWILCVLFTSLTIKAFL